MVTHGTNAGYSAGCRCDPCKEASRAYQKAYRERLRAEGKTLPGKEVIRLADHRGHKPTPKRLTDIAAEFRSRRSQEKANEIRRLRSLNPPWSYKMIAVHMGMSERQCWGLDKQNKSHHGATPDVPNYVVPLEEVIAKDPTMAECLADTPEGFKAFFERFSPYKPKNQPPKNCLAPHNFHIVQSWFDYETGTWKQEVIVNAAPRMAKSEGIMWFIIWRVVLDRSVRVILVSRTHDRSVQDLKQIARTLEGDADLLQTFGPFKDEGATWSPSDGILDCLGRSEDIKEDTIRSRGAMHQIQGFGCDWFFGDDVVMLANSSTPEQREKLQHWWNTECVTRREPGAHIFLVGTRIHPDDLYGRLLQMTYLDPDDEEEMGPDAEPEPLWRHVVLAALVDPETGEPSDAREAVSLWPEKWTARSLRRTRETVGSATWGATYQQNPLADGMRFVLPDWFWGSTEPYHKGCVDAERAWGQASWGRETGSVRAIAIDPAVTNWLVAVVADVRPKGSEATDGEWCSVVDIHRSRLTGVSPASILTMVKQWNKMYGPIDRLIFERNGFQRWFLTEQSVRDFFAAEGIRVVPHETGVNLADPIMGFKTTQADYEFGRIRFPGAGERSKTLAFASEATSYTGGKDTKDQLMAMWFIKHARERGMLRRWESSGGTQTQGFRLPSHLREVRWTR